MALREYVCYRCFDKEGEAIDLQKAERYKMKYDDYVLEYQAENELFDTNRLMPDSNFIAGPINNRLPNTYTGRSGYNTLRL